MTVGSPARIERPADRAELARILRECDARGQAVVFRGGDTFASLGFAAERCDAVIDTRGLDRIVAYEPADLTIGVECGMTVDALDRTLAEHGQFIALDVPRSVSATVGGALSAGWLGPRRASYGRARDAIIGSTAVLADGTIANAGGMVVKNVTGYDLSRLYLGSLGTLAAIASVNFKTSPLPARSVALRATLAAGSRARVLDALRRSDVDPAAALISIGYARELGTEPEGDGTLLVIFEGSEALTQALGACGVTLTRSDRSAAHVLAEAVDASIAPVDATTTIYKTFGKSSDLEDRHTTLCAIAKFRGFACEAILDARTGDLTARFTPSAAVDLDEATLALDTEVHGRPERALVLRTADSIRGRLEMWGRPAGAVSVMQSLKTQFDPNRTLAPGRFLNHI